MNEPTRFDPVHWAAALQWLAFVDQDIDVASILLRADDDHVDFRPSRAAGERVLGDIRTLRALIMTRAPETGA